MTAFILGAVGALTFLAVFAAGAVLGYGLHKKLTNVFPKRTGEEKTPEEIEDERKRLKAQQDAFRTLQNYSAETAYGLTDEPRTGG